jgi:hypothetical protein
MVPPSMNRNGFGIEDFDKHDLIQALKQNSSILEFSSLYVTGFFDKGNKTKVRYYAGCNK